ncbi:unnamed protein product [Moneuplotes crassus]|uniref:RBR-type E3 ubiquitin transferase n=1 Tax=Euplotes crassus TaxID=5936 RepID=A0AAD1UG37_EUPCR|nr:unnamed protein product [Moneuplotes crassus]
MLSSVQSKCEGFDHTLMFVMGALFTKFKKQLKLEEVIELIEKLQSIVTSSGSGSVESLRIFRTLYTQVRAQDVLKLSYFKSSSTIPHQRPSTAVPATMTPKPTTSKAPSAAKPKTHSYLRPTTAHTIRMTKLKKPSKSPRLVKKAPSAVDSPRNPKTIKTLRNQIKVMKDTQENRKLSEIKKVQEALAIIQKCYEEESRPAGEEEKEPKEEEKVPVTSAAKGMSMEMKERQNLIDLEKTPICFKDSKCPICYDKIEVKEMALTQCGHMYHAECFEMYIRSKVEVKSFPLKCPMRDCLSKLPESDFKNICDEKLYQKYERFEFEHFCEQNPDLYHFCPTPDCQYVFEWDISKGPYKHQCTICSETFCLKCKEKWHQGFSCEEFKQIKESSPEDLDTVCMIKKEKFQRCTKCKYWVQKSEGCDHITCRCSYQFCYVCGGEYQKCGHVD